MMVRQETPIDGSCEGQHVYISGSRLTKSFGAFVERRPRCEDVVDDQHALSLHGLGYAKSKGLTQVGKAGRTGKGRLSSSIDDTNKIGVRKRCPQLSTYGLSQQQGLVVLPCPEASGMQGDGHDHINVH